MDSKTRIGLEVLGVSVLLGLLGNAWLRTPAWGANAFLWSWLCLGAGCVLVYRWRPSVATRLMKWVLPVGVVALLYIWRDAGWLRLAHTVAFASVLLYTIKQIRFREDRKSHPFPSEPGLIQAGWYAIRMWPRFLRREIEWQSVSTPTAKDRFKSIIRGVVISGPVVFLFGVLLMAADVHFETLVYRLFDVELERLPSQLVWVIGIAWVTGSLFWGWVLYAPVPVETEGRASGLLDRLRFGSIEGLVMLGLINVLFLVFVLIQLPYLFGGEAFVESSMGLTIAQYVRRGFFELVAVASLALPLLIGLCRRAEAGSDRDRRWVYGLAGLQVGLLMVILLSAGHRMWIYQQLYGLTELRLYTSVFMGWLGFVFIWFVGTVLWGRAEWFVRGALGVAWIVVLGLHFLNPDALIVRTNVDRAVQGQSFDPAYISSLSADAVPALLDALPRLDPAQRQPIAEALIWQWGYSDPDWRVWNRARAEAHARVHAQMDALYEQARPDLSNLTPDP